MSLVKLSIRIPTQLDSAIIKYAERSRISRYAALVRVVETGVAELIGGRPTAVTSNEIADMLAEILARVSYSVRLADRALYASALAWAASRQAALRTESNPEQINKRLIEIGEDAYQRQMGIAGAAGEP